MKVLCVHDYNAPDVVTIGKWYEVVRKGIIGYNYLIIDNLGGTVWVDLNNFKTMGQVREEKLNELGLS